MPQSLPRLGQWNTSQQSDCLFRIDHPLPLLTVIAGPNGSGKSTLIASLLEQGVELGLYLNADDIARDLYGAPAEVAAQAQQLVRDRRQAALAEQCDHSFETVMSHMSHIDYMRGAAAAVFDVRLCFVATEDPAVNLDRIDNRVAHGGHPVPADRVVLRYFRCLANLPAAIAVSNECRLFDNTYRSAPLRPLARIATLQGWRRLWHDSGLARVWGQVDPQALPVWWLAVLLEIKLHDPYADGYLA